MNADRSELLQLLSTHGVLMSTDEQPVLSHDGTRMAWMLDSLRVSMTARGAELAARCLLEELSKFEATQIATYGVTAIPLLQSCIAFGGGKYTGIVVRKETKAYGAGKILEGTIDPTKPVVVLDDSLASGTSMMKCIEALEAGGLHVEGGVVLVRFGFGGGWARMISRGLRMEMVFDVFRDMVPIADPARVVPANLSDRLPPFAWADAAAPDGIHPTALARSVIEAFLAKAPIPRPPARLDAEYDTSGGCFVSARSRANLFVRHARNGYWVFTGEPRPTAGEAIIKAALRTAPMITREQLDESALAVTNFGALEKCTVGELDQERYGIVVHSTDRPECLGGSLPSMPTLFRDWAQFDHARTRNAKLFAFERFELFRHTVTKAVEPGAAWQVDGVPRPPAPRWHLHAPRITERARELVRAAIAGSAPAGDPLPDGLLDGEVEGVYLSVFRDGQVAACVGTRVGASLDETLKQLAMQVPRDARFRGSKEARSLVVVASFLDNKIVFPGQTPAAIATHVDPRRHALVVQQNTRTALMLPFVSLQQSLTQVQFVAELVDKAGITRAPYHWTRMEATSWYADGEKTCPLPWGLPPATPPASIAAAIEHLLPRMLEYLRVHERPDGQRTAYYRALVNRAHGELERPRQIHGAWTIAAAYRALGGDALGARAKRNIETFVGATLELNEAAVLLLALVEREPDHPLVATLVTRLGAAIDGFGGIVASELPAMPAMPPGTDAAKAREFERARNEQLLDFLLPQITLALARTPRADLAAIHRALHRASRRFAVLPSWAQVCWLPQAAAAVHAIAPDAAIARMAFDVVEWALPYQQVSTGAFINGEQLDSPGCSTAVYLEGVAAALELAVAVGDQERADRYRASALAALRFVDELTYQERDAGMLPAPERAYGGLRLSRTAGDVRTDFVQHAVHALLRLRTLV
jgi:orotate phosphoribosyltransferase/AMMECR1 domain-containing protein